MNWSVSTYFCTKHIYQNLVFVSCTHRDLYLMYLYLIYAPLVNQGCKVFMLHRSQRKNGEEKFFVRWSRRCRAVKTCRDSYFQISMSQHCSSDLGSPHTHLWASCSFLLVGSQSRSSGSLGALLNSILQVRPSWSWILLSAQDRQVTTLSPSQLAARQQQRGQFEAAAATWGKAIIQRSLCDNQTARKAEEREDRCSQLIAAVAGPK